MFKIAAVSRRDTRTGSCSACCLFGPAARWCVTFVFEGATATFERVGRAAAGGRCREIRLSGPLFMLYTPLKHRARCATALNFHRVRSNVGTRHIHSSSMRLLRCNNAPRFLRSVRGIRDVFMSKREKGGWFRTLLYAVSRASTGELAYFLPIRAKPDVSPPSSFPSSNAFEFIQTLYTLRVRLFAPGPNLNSFFAIRERILPSGFYLISLLNEISIRRLLETGVQFSRSPFPELRWKHSFVSSKFASDYSWTGDFTIMEGNKDFRDSLQSVSVRSVKETRRWRRGFFPNG